MCMCELRKDEFWSTFFARRVKLSVSAEGKEIVVKNIPVSRLESSVVELEMLGYGYKISSVS